MFDLSDAATLPEMVSNGQDGLVFPAGNSQQLYIKLKYLLENDLIREQFAHHAKVWAHKRW
ncbi:glycosyltransferase [Peribacillus sp. FSL R5-0717]|jgi:hypothetical protein|uniref:glycosyltransferase n=1 Tax=Peribacillus sp. FSL R5-0717 TaxID=2975308 RepID=UPI0030F756E3